MAGLTFSYFFIVDYFLDKENYISVDKYPSAKRRKVFLYFTLEIQPVSSEQLASDF